MDQIELQAKVLAQSIAEPNTGCWLWLGYIDRSGYGRVHYRHLRIVSAHRLSYQAFRGPIPDNLTIDHLCRLRCCVNPEHLEAVPKKVNTLRGVSFSAQNARLTHCVNGHALAGDNLKVGPTGRRFCRTCWRDRSRAYAKRKLVAA